MQRETLWWCMCVCLCLCVDHPEVRCYTSILSLGSWHCFEFPASALLTAFIPTSSVCWGVVEIAHLLMIVILSLLYWFYTSYRLLYYYFNGISGGRGQIFMFRLLFWISILTTRVQVYCCICCVPLIYRKQHVKSLMVFVIQWGNSTYSLLTSIKGRL